MTLLSEPALAPRPLGAILRSGISNAFGPPALVLFSMLIGVGGLARDSGYPLGVAILSTVLIWAAPGQLVFFAALAGGASLPAAAVAISVSSIRLLPMCVSLLPVLRGPKTPIWRQFGFAHFIAVTAWVEGMRRLPSLPANERGPYFLAFALTIMVAAALGTALGHQLVGALPAALAAGLLFTSPIYFTLSLVVGAREGMDRAAILLGFLLAPLAALVAPGGFDLILIGLVGGALAYGGRRVRRRGAHRS